MPKLDLGKCLFARSRAGGGLEEDAESRLHEDTVRLLSTRLATYRMLTAEQTDLVNLLTTAPLLASVAGQCQHLAMGGNFGEAPPTAGANPGGVPACTPASSLPTLARLDVYNKMSIAAARVLSYAATDQVKRRSLLA